MEFANSGQMWRHPSPANQHVGIFCKTSQPNSRGRELIVRRDGALYLQDCFSEAVSFFGSSSR